MAIQQRLGREVRAPAWLDTDERLAARSGRGDAVAFGKVFERHHQALYRYCRAILHNDQDAEDALQNTMLSAWRALRASGRRVPLRPWLFRIAHNEAISIHRQRRRLDRRAEAASLELQQGSASPDALQAAEQREDLRELLADLHWLAPRQRSALLMHELSGLSMREVAIALSVSAGAAKQLIFEARRALGEASEGRAMDCEAVRRSISDGDRRILRSRKLQAHLRACGGCAAFQQAIPVRAKQLRALVAPLPLSASSSLFARVLGQAAGSAHSGSAAGVAGGSGGGLGATTGLGSSVSIAHIGLASAIKAIAGAALLAGATAGAVVLTAGHAKQNPRQPARSSRHASAAGPTESTAPVGLRAVAGKGSGTPGKGRAAATHAFSAPAGGAQLAPAGRQSPRSAGTAGTAHSPALQPGSRSESPSVALPVKGGHRHSHPTGIGRGGHQALGPGSGAHGRRPTPSQGSGSNSRAEAGGRSKAAPPESAANAHNQAESGTQTAGSGKARSERGQGAAKQEKAGK